uniref:Uncharacterized protein n=1 Tax=Globisporangium ultimum (strain ATCC 200006 / CBS 805.95 / DAOM BR144) TaxID=431595 RepID=K3X9S5_GLOUD
MKPAKLGPEWVSKRSQISAALKQIECVCVESTTNANGIRRYAICVYERTSKNRIPTNQSQPQASNRNMVARTELSYSEFADLRGRLYNEAQMAHGATRCGFCERIIDEIANSDNKPGTLLRLFASDTKVTEALARSVNVLLDLVNRNEETRLCTGQEQIPQELYDFLFNTESETE